MTASHWERVQELFHAAVELNESERVEFLNGTCGADTGLCREVRNLLNAATVADEFLESSLAGASADLFDLQPNEQIGPYSIIRTLGEGGMGTVYLGVRCDDEYHKVVAIKFIRAGFAGPEPGRRFRSERQILANLEHPGIARLLDGGTTSGSPYLVMEYVDGLAIDDYCRQQHLSVRERLRLFQRVCAAVSYAHRHLVVHRDIKPSNILVTSEGEPKLLDFGIAKLLLEAQTDAPATRAAERFLTPEYSSPEQIRGEAITTAADVYSLGVLLYELLAGAKPFRLEGESFTECERIICETTPPKPSTAGGGKEAAGDLDSITLTAMRKEVARRYPSVDSLHEDVQRYLDGMPVRAQPDRWQYRASKFVRRHRPGTAIAAAIMLLLGTAIFLIISAERESQAARLEAEQRFQTVLAMADSSLFEIDEAIAEHRGTTEERALVVQRVLEYLNLLARRGNRKPALDRELARAYEKLCDIQFHDGPGNLGDSSGALISARKALELRQRLARSSGRPEVEAVAGDLMRVAALEGLTGNVVSGTENYSRARRVYESLANRFPQDRSLRSQVAEAYLQTGNLERLLNSGVASARGDLEKGFEIRKASLASLPQDEASLRGMEEARVFLADFEHQQTGNEVDAFDNIERALAIARQLCATFPDNTGYRSDLASILLRVGRIQLSLKKPAKAIPLLRESLRQFDGLGASDQTDAKFVRDRAIVAESLAEALFEAGKPKEAEALYRGSLAILLGLMRAYPNHRDTQYDVAGAQTSLGALLTATGRVDEGIGQLEASLKLTEGLVAADPENMRCRSRLAGAERELGRAWEKKRQPEQAISAFQAEQILVSELEGKMRLADTSETVAREIERCKAGARRLSQTASKYQ